MLLKNSQCEQGAHSRWLDSGLIEVDLMPNSTLGIGESFSDRNVDGIQNVSGLDLNIRLGDVYN